MACQNCEALENEKKVLREDLAEAKRELHLVQRQLEQYQTKQVTTLHERRLRALRTYESDREKKIFLFYHFSGQAGDARCYEELPHELKNHDSQSDEDQIG